jgi:superfamily II DNA or RNA helicase
MFGFSATINTRSDNAHFHLYEIFGDIIFKMTFVDAVKRDLIVPIAVQWINVPEGAEISKDADYVRLKKQGIWRNEHRNRIIADIAKKYFNEGRQVLILVETVDHAINLKHLLQEFVVCAADIDLNQYEFYKKRGYEVQDVLESIHKRDELKEKFKSRNLKGVIATNIWSAGVSFDDLEVLIRADGRVSKTVNIQAPGRVCRIPTSVDKEFGIVVDFIDRFDIRLYKRAQRRFQYYKQMGWFQCNENWEILRSLKE